MQVSQSDENRVRDSVCVVLSRTTHPGNIGAVARAMKNMGLVQLRLVNPSPALEIKDDGSESEIRPQDSHEAVRRSSGAHDILENCQTFSSMEEALSDCQLIVGASARTRKMNWPLINPRKTAKIVVESVFVESSPAKVALVFGNEASGLSNEELQLCHYHVNIPAVESFASLNLAMAVQLICYEVRMALLTERDENKIDSSKSEPLELETNAPILSSGGDEEEVQELASFKELDGLLSHLEDTLVKIGYLDVDNPRQLMPKLRRLYSRARLEKVEVNILRGILKATQKYRS